MNARRVGILVAWVVSAPAALSAQVPIDTVVSAAATFTVEVVLDGLRAPVAMTRLPDGRLLVAERSPARLSLLDAAGRRATVATGLEVFDEGDAGLLDVVPGPSWDEDRWIYLAYVARVEGDVVTVVDRARLVDGPSLEDVERVFAATPMVGDTVHYGGRIAFADGHLFLTLGERYQADEAQSLASYNGTVVRIRLDGSVPPDNPFTGRPGALAPIWSFGHRNPQGMAVHPESGVLWVNEHGPQGGDELNLVRPGANYGWPLVTYGEEYGGGPIGDGSTDRPGMERPAWYWRPSIGPSDMAFVDGPAFAGWRGDALIGAMALRHLSRVVFDGDRVIHVEPLLGTYEWRIRMVEATPDGTIWLGTDSGLLVRLREVGSGG